MANKLLTDGLSRQYQRDGFVAAIPVLLPDEVRRFRAACDELEIRLGGKPRTVEVRQMHLHLPWAYELASHPRVLDAVEDLLGPNLLVWATELFAKHPQDSFVSIGWHRDDPYMGLDAERTVTAWIALSESTAANGCMKVVVESDRRKAAAMSSKSSASRKNHETLDVVLRAGEMSLHDPYVLHGSGPNQSSDKRVGFVIRYVSADARPASGRPSAMLVRGVDSGEFFQLVSPPREMEPQQALLALKRSAADHLDAMLQNLITHQE